MFNNLKTKFNTEFLNIHDVIPSVFRKTDYSLDEINDLARADFIKWASVYGIDATTNSGYDRNNYTTYNYASTKDYVFDCQLPGSWRAIYKFYFDTDRPNTHPWEMLGFTIMPEWWESYYGPAPYTSGNKILWDDLEEGRIRQGSRQGIDAKYARPGLSTIIPETTILPIITRQLRTMFLIANYREAGEQFINFTSILIDQILVS